MKNVTVRELREQLFKIENQDARVEFSLDFGGDTLVNSTYFEIIDRNDDGYIELVYGLEDSDMKQLIKDCENISSDVDF